MNETVPVDRADYRRLRRAVIVTGIFLMARPIYSLVTVDTESGSVALQAVIHRTLFASWLEPRAASLAFAARFVLVWLAILWQLYRRGIVLKV